MFGSIYNVVQVVYLKFNSEDFVMPLKFFSPTEVDRMMKLAEKSYRPKQILELQEAIESETRVAEVRLASTGVLDQKHAMKIVEMMLQKDALYGAWTRGEIE